MFLPSFFVAYLHQNLLITRALTAENRLSVFTAGTLLMKLQESLRHSETQVQISEGGVFQLERIWSFIKSLFIVLIIPTSNIASLPLTLIKISSRVTFGKITERMARVNFRIFTNSTYIWFLSFFLTKKPLSERLFSEKSRKSYIGWIRKIREFTLVIIIVIFLQKWQLIKAKN